MFHKCEVPAAERNKKPILEELKQIIKIPSDNQEFPSVKVLEISSGNGRHITYFAKSLSRKIFWQPSEYEKKMFSSICAYIEEEKLENVAPPIFIDVRDSFLNWNPLNENPSGLKLEPIAKFEEDTFDYIYNSNLMHISPFDCSEGLFENSGKLLKKTGCLITYGPYSQNGVLTPESNVRFDAGLRSTNPAWGVRDIQLQLMPLAQQNGLCLTQIIDMPANNKILTWVKI